MADSQTTTWNPFTEAPPCLVQANLMPAETPTTDCARRKRRPPLEPCPFCGTPADHSCPRSKTTDVTPEFKALTDAIIAAGHTCETVLRRLDARIAGTPEGVGRDNLMNFRQQLVEKIRSAESHG